ncbi:MAG: RNA-binding transcriptional accessory protein [Deferribacterales bacterium]
MIDILSSEYNINGKYIKNLLDLTGDGATVPFIARYRKEMTGGMNETEIREILDRYNYIVNLEKRREEVIKAIDEKGKLTDELKFKILAATTLKKIEDLYSPYKSKKKTKADIAIERGLLPLAEFIKTEFDELKIVSYATNFINDEVPNADDALEGAMEILSFDIGHDIEIKNRVRELLKDKGVVKTEKRKDVTGRTNYEDYYNFQQEVSKIPPHRVLAIFRGESEKVLKVKIEVEEEVLHAAVSNILLNRGYILNKYINTSIKYAVKRILLLSLELELRNELFEVAEDKAIGIFADNLKTLLLTPPVKNKKILGIDPAYRTGCKFAAIDETSKLLTYGVIYPTEPQNDYENSKKTILDVIEKYKINAIAIGNGTASRETEEFVSRVINEANLEIGYTIVSEAGASVYSASEVAIKEFPDLDVTIRGAISIARRVLDPLSELIKIDHKAIGVGMYQHDINQKKLSKKLDEVVTDVVNSVGVDLNTASPSLLRYISGLNSNIAEKVVEYRNMNGFFRNRKELLNVTGLGETAFKMAAGFLKIYGGDEPLDRLFIHPEQYLNVYNLLSYLNLTMENASLIRLKLKGIDTKKICDKFNFGEMTLNDIITNLEKPDMDIRDKLEPVVFKKDILKFEDLKVGDYIDGKVTNVVDFGVFVDIGLKESGFIHISELSDRFIKHPSQVLKVGEMVRPYIKDIDIERRRVALSLKSKLE